MLTQLRTSMTTAVTSHRYKLGSAVRQVLSEFSQRFAKHFQEKSFKNNFFSGTDNISI